MKKQFLFLFSLFFLIQACAQNQKTETSSVSSEISYTEKDAEIFADILSKYKDESDKPIATLIPCTTYAENLLALARTIKSENQTFEQFAKEIEKIRYRDGKRDEYPSRLHYFSDWIYNNKENDLVTTPADSFGNPFPNKVSFMSNNPDSYKHLKNNPDYVSVIEQQEKEINEKSYFFIPKENIAEYEHLLKEGDIIGLTTSINGLDVAHVGVLVEQDGKLHLLHASQSKLKVEISDEPISSFLKPESKNTGIMIARPVEI